MKRSRKRVRRKKNMARKLNAEHEWKRINIIDVVQLKNDRELREHFSGKRGRFRLAVLKAFHADGNCLGKQMLDHKFLLFKRTVLSSVHRGTKDVTEAIMQPLQSNTPLKDLSGKGDGQSLAHGQWKPEAALIPCQQWRGWQGENMTLSGPVVMVPGGSVRLTFPC